MSRMRAMQASSFGSRKSNVPLMAECIAAPPSSSAEIFCSIPPCTGFARGIIRDAPYPPRLHPRQPGDYAGCRGPAPFFVHTRGRVNTKLEECSRIGEKANPFAGREPSLAVLAFYSLCAPAFPNLLFLVVYLRHQVRHKTHVGFIAAGGGIYTRGQNRGIRGRGGFDAVSHSRVRKTFGCEP